MLNARIPPGNQFGFLEVFSQVPIGLRDFFSFTKNQNLVSCFWLWYREGIENHRATIRTLLHPIPIS